MTRIAYIVHQRGQRGWVYKHLACLALQDRVLEILVDPDPAGFNIKAGICAACERRLGEAPAVGVHV